MVTSLPIVGRELREASRRRGTYWVRLLVAAQATLVAVGAWVASEVNPTVKFGAALFWGLAAVAMIHCLLAGRRSTADCLSSEKREGTMGLLFLTDLKGFDVVVGKLVATSLGGFYGLLAIFPVLGVPLLVGGMTSGEFWRMAVLLVVTFFFSLSIGLFCSAGSREYKEAIGRNFLLLMTPTVLLPIAGAFFALGSGGFNSAFFLMCPYYTFRLCQDTIYLTNAGEYWAALTLMLGLSCLFITRACQLLPISWQDQPTGARMRLAWWKTLKNAITYGSAEARAAFRKWALDQNAYFWLAARERLKPVHVWVFLAAASAWWLIGWAANENYWLGEISDITMALLLTATLKLWVTVEAGQRLALDREIGAMELLLCTELTVDDYLRGQFLALRRQFLRPLAAALLAMFLLMVLALYHHAEHGWLPWLAAMVMLPLDVITLSWVGIWTALQSKTHTRATLGAAARILILPWAGLGAISLIIWLLRLLNLLPDEDTKFTTLLGIWFFLGVAADVYFGWRAWQATSAEFRELAMQRYGARAKREKKTVVRSLPRRWQLATTGAVVVIVACGVAWARARAHFPPPVVVRLAAKKAPLQAFPGLNYGLFLILPDGSLWRWGQAEGPQFKRFASPEQIGTNYDWVKVAADYEMGVLGLRGDGTIWQWGATPETNLDHPVQVGSDHDWKDIECSQGLRVGLRQDGTMWMWLRIKVGQPVYRLSMVSSGSNWARLTINGPREIICVESNGTAWTWGGYRANFSYPAPTASPVNPSLIPANWLGVRRPGWPSLALEEDGTLWTQGVDYSADPEVSFWRTLDLARHGVARRYNFREALPRYSDEPRPLMKFYYP